MPLTASLSLPYGAHPRQRIDVFVPESAPGPLLCCIDGGWWTDGRCAAQRAFALLLAEHGLAVANLGHRPLGDGARTGDEVLTDLVEAATKALEEAGVIGFNGHALALLGHGSGSLSAFNLLHRLGRKTGVRAVVACGALATLEPGGSADAHRAACDRFAMARHRDLSPLHLDPSAWPSVLLMHGDADGEVPLDQAKALQAHIAATGESCPLEVVAGAGHRFAEDAAAAPARQAAKCIAGFLAEYARETASVDFSFGCKP